MSKRKVEIPEVKQLWVPWDLWECIAAGMYEPATCRQSDFDQFKVAYSKFLADSDGFRTAAVQMTLAWPKSCMNFLTNPNINRIAWIGQASACFEIGLPSSFRSGFWLLTEEQQNEANYVAATVLREWIIEHKRNQEASRAVRGNLERQMLFEWPA